MTPRTWTDAPEPGGGAAMPSMTPVTKKLLWINGILFLFFAVFVHMTLPTGIDSPDAVGLGQRCMSYLALDTQAWRSGIPPLWQLLTYGFLHSTSDPWHILMNLLSLYFFGTLFEGIVGPTRYLWVYLTAIVLGGAAQVTAAFITGQDSWTVGASGGVLCIIVATAVLQPNVRVIFILVPLTLKVLALILVGLDLFHAFFGGGGATAYVVHLTGAAWGFAAARQRWIWWDPTEAWKARQVVRERESREENSARLDRLLAKIHSEGIQKLSSSDKAFLKRMSDRNSTGGG
jgi:membrane associated rhomboid family serine protease